MSAISPPSNEEYQTSKFFNIKLTKCLTQNTIIKELQFLCVKTFYYYDFYNFSVGNILRVPEGRNKFGVEKSVTIGV